MNYKKYTKFMMIAPRVTFYWGGNYHLHGIQDLEAATEREFDFCYDFVIESALHLQEFEIDPEVIATTRTSKKVSEWEKKAQADRAEWDRQKKVDSED